MLFAMGFISSGTDPGTRPTQSSDSVRVIVHTSAREIPITFGALAFSESLVPPQSGHTESLRNFSTRFIPFSSFTFDRAFSTV